MASGSKGKGKEQPRTSTPVWIQGITSSAFLSGNLQAARHVITRDLGNSIPEIPFEAFATYILPPLPSKFSLKMTEADLTEAGVLRKRCKMKWTEFPKEPTNMEGIETVIYKGLAKIHSAIIECASNSTSEPATASYFFGGSVSLASSKSTKSKPDGWCALVPNHELRTDEVRRISKARKLRSKRREEWLNVTRVDEYKRQDNEHTRQDNVEKVCWSLHQIMSVDPRRRFAFGVTVENTQMRIWFCCRQVVLVSERFDFLRDHGKFIHVVVSLCFASPNDLGFDNTVKLKYERCKDDFQFEMTVRVHDQIGHEQMEAYQTLETISDYAADALCGRATRTFKAKKANSQGAEEDIIVIKDVWVDSDRKREQEIYKEIKEAWDTSYTTDSWPLLTIVGGGDVQLSGHSDTTDRIMRGLQLQDFKNSFCFGPNPLHISSSQTSAIGLPFGAAISGEQTLPHYFKPKTHYRILYEEFGISLSSTTTMRGALDIVKNSITALKTLHRMGYVHRDLHLDNILSFQGRVLLGDIEYAKRYDDITDTTHAIRTGLLQFLPLEVEASEYLFKTTALHPLRLKDLQEEDGVEVDVLTKATALLLKGKETAIDSPKMPFAYNPLHDIESILWMAAWFIMWHGPPKEGKSAYPQSMAEVDEQLRSATELFSATMANRLSFIKIMESDNNIIPYTSKAFGKEYGETVGKAICLLHVAYVEAEMGNQINKKAFLIHDKILEILNSMSAEDFDLVRITDIQKSYPVPKAKKK
ncbi:hypothetical protein CPB84DRAFT_1793973 [Gymnopilus junonius]|uniref:Fungal-type protein kinase domain-containing protein n=1 Tax=Gymnopilus junonius TaxID=109634 RepID=A0A9P5NAN1_GYMJU|nr:hypothetical protein CPB84DRAFT_1793973 [Gymnopilus junonius]